MNWFAPRWSRATAVIVERVPAADLDLTAFQKPVDEQLVQPPVDVELVGFPFGGVHEGVLRGLVGQHFQYRVRTAHLVSLCFFGKLG